MMTIKIIKRRHVRFRVRCSKGRNRKRKNKKQSRDKGGETLKEASKLFIHFATTFHGIE